MLFCLQEPIARPPFLCKQRRLELKNQDQRDALNQNEGVAKRFAQCSTELVLSFPCMFWRDGFNLLTDSRPPLQIYLIDPILKLFFNKDLFHKRD